MAQLFAVILLIGFAIFAFKVALLLIFLVGLIFRTKETIGLLVVLGILWFLRTYPAVSFTALGILAVVAFVQNGQRQHTALTAEEPAESPPEPKLLE